MLTKLLQWICAINGLPSGMCSTHSFRVGGATSLHRNGIPFDAIRRFGRWVRDCFEIYLRNDEIALRYLCDQLGKGHGLLAQHRIVAKNQQTVRSAEYRNIESAESGKRWEVGGYGGDESTPSSRQTHELTETDGYTATPRICAKTMGEEEHERELARTAFKESRFQMGGKQGKRPDGDTTPEEHQSEATSECAPSSQRGERNKKRGSFISLRGRLCDKKIINRLAPI